MTISWHGFNYFKLKNTSHSLIFNPYGLDKVTKFSKVNADIILFSDSSQIAKTKLNKEGSITDKTESH